MVYATSVVLLHVSYIFCSYPLVFLSRTMNGLDPSSLTSMAPTRTVSPPGMLPLSV